MTLNPVARRNRVVYSWGVRRWRMPRERVLVETIGGPNPVLADEWPGWPCRFCGAPAGEHWLDSGACTVAAIAEHTGFTVSGHLADRGGWPTFQPADEHVLVID